MKIGMKCEIHSCTIEFVKISLKDYFTDEEFDLIEDSLKARIDSQYYADRSVPDKIYEDMITNSPDFLVKSKSILIRLNEKKVNEIRDKFQKLMDKSD